MAKSLSNVLETSVKTKYIWRGNKYLTELAREAAIGVKQAADVYEAALKKALNRTVGSDPISGSLRVRKRHSAPGQVPYWQTGNLANSIKATYTSRYEISGGKILGFGKELKIYGRVSAKTDVPYAKTLEFGGRLMMPHDNRPYTHWRLINPLKTHVYTRARPAWRPTFKKWRSTMEYMIVGHLKKVKI